MNITAFAQKKPAIIFVITLFILLVGIVGYATMPKMILPQIKVPGAVIETSMTGGTAQQIDHNITEPLLVTLKSLGHVSSLLGTSFPGESVITIEFPIGTDPLQAFQNVVTKVNQARSILPKNMQNPQVTQLNLTNVPIMTLALHSDTASRLALSQYAKNTIVKALDNLPGVENVVLSGGRNKIVKVLLDPVKMTSYGVDIQQVVHAFKSENVEFPGYFIDTLNKSFLLNLDEKFHALSQINDLIVKTHAGSVVHLNEIATVQYGSERTRGAVRFNGKPAVGLVVTKMASENSITVINNIKKLLATTIIPQLPKEMQLSVAHDSAHAITRNVNGLELTVIYAILFASLIVYLFIRSFRSLFIIIIAIPVSVLMGVAVLRLTGGTFNIITLLSLVLLVGLVVDDAIVVTENVHRVRLRHPELSAREGTLKGVKQVTFAVLASTITLLVIFSSAVVMKSDMAVIFEAFSVSILAGVTTSYVVSMTLTPIMAEHFMVVSEKQNRFYTLLQKIVDGYVAGYKWLLRYVLTLRCLVVVLTVAYMVPVFFVLRDMGSGFFPQGEDHAAIRININAPSDATLNYTQNILTEIDQKIKDMPQIQDSYAVIGPLQANTASVYLKLKPLSKTKVTSTRIMNEVANRVATIPGALLNVTPVPVSKVFAQPLVFDVIDSDYSRLMQHIIPFVIALKQNPKFGALSNTVEPNQVQYKLIVNRALANRRGVSAENVMESVALFGGHVKVGSIIPNENKSEQYSIFLDPKKGSLINLSDINKIYLFGGGRAIQLSTIAHFKRVLLPSVIHRTGTRFSVQFSGAPTIPVNDALSQIKAIGHTMFAKGTQIVASGQASASQTELHSTMAGLGFSFLALYLILTIQFDSFLQPLVVLAAEPLALVGAVYALSIFGYTLNMFSLIGILLLMGLVAKNAILLVSRTNQYRAEGEGIQEALMHACPERLVPITMTSLTIILAMIPVLFHQGVGAKSQVVLSVTIVAGIIASTVLSVIVVPAIYAILEIIKQKLGERFVAKTT
ncbi:MAG: hypothetical protein COB66_08235 [Coxiella sp. (in: Bacteria)]|nr:MAG: hypothetical protein COB66_08235 [Coxiella sp. (in: g-proteobacteria)]